MAISICKEMRGHAPTVVLQMHVSAAGEVQGNLCRKQKESWTGTKDASRTAHDLLRMVPKGCALALIMFNG